MDFGLFEVVPGIYQVRRFDLAVISFIKGKTGWIIIDPLTVKETSRAALQFVNEKLGHRPVVAVIISHSHADHFGGIRGVVSDADLKAGKVQILAPKGFMREAISENLYAGNAMTRRKVYTYGDALPARPSATWTWPSARPWRWATWASCLPPGSLWNPSKSWKSMGCIDLSEYSRHGSAGRNEHLVSRLRCPLAGRKRRRRPAQRPHPAGAQVRDLQAWAKYINVALYKWGDRAKVIFQSHNWPTLGERSHSGSARGERDMYANLNNQVLHLANSGVTINEVHNVFELPQTLQNQWFAQGCTGPMPTTAALSSNAIWASGTAIPLPCCPCRPEMPRRSMWR